MSATLAPPRPVAAVSPATADTPVIDRENPWPGLVSFPEAAEAFFNGRDAERDELLRLIRRDTLTLLYSLSGLGKSSLLRAGLFPLLRKERFLPVYVRLDHAETSPPHDEQVMRALLAECAASGVEAPPPRPRESVWQLLHRADGGFWDIKNYPITPVLVIDQFEEIFTLGVQTPERRARSDTFLAELGDLIDNRAPEALVRFLDAHPDQASAYAFASPGCKIVLSMREDFLPELGRLGEHTRSTFQNYLRVLRMRGDTAVDAILRTGGRLVEHDAARAIVCFLARVPHDRQETVDLSTAEVEPALLSLVCRELNERRREAGLHKIDIGLLDVSQTAILTKFYDESFAGMKPGMQVFVEEELLTETGFRDAAALDDAMRLPDVTTEAIDALVARRLIRKEERFGTPRIELTHDVLTDVVRESRDRRRMEEEAEKRRREHEAATRARRRRAAVGLTIVMALALFVFIWSADQAADAREQERNNLVYRANVARSEAEVRRERERVQRMEAEARRMELQAQRLDSTLTQQQAVLAASQRALARKEDSVRVMLRTTQAALQRADESELEALVGAETADYYLDVTGRTLRRQVAQSAAVDSTARVDLARADALRRESEAQLQRLAELEEAVASVVCANQDKASVLYTLRERLDGALSGRPLCGGERAQPQPSRRPAAALRGDQP